MYKLLMAFAVAYNAVNLCAVFSQFGHMYYTSFVEYIMLLKTMKMYMQICQLYCLIHLCVCILSEVNFYVIACRPVRVLYRGGGTLGFPPPESNDVLL